jgi:hypothetical protein
MHHTARLTLLALTLACCAASAHADKQTQQAGELAAQARAAAGSLIKTLGGQLKSVMATAGPEQAIDVCKQMAPAIAAEVSAKTGMSVKRVSDRNRNPKGVPDAWEAQAIAELEQRLAAGEKPETLDMYAVVDSPQGKTFRYAKALVTQPLCLSCHGKPETLSAGVKARLAAEYPNDKAVGYSAGMLRGIVSVSKPM